MRLSLIFRCKGESYSVNSTGSDRRQINRHRKYLFFFAFFSVRFRLFRSLIGKQGGKSLNTGGDLYGILRALSDEPINRQRQKRSFRLIYRLSVQHIRCVEQRSAYRCLHSVLRARTAFAPRPGKTLHRTVLFPPASSPVRLNQTQRHPTGASVFGAGGGTLRSNRPLLALRAARPDCFRSPAGQNAPQDRFVSPGFESRST